MEVDMIIVDTVEVKNGERIMETYGDVLCEPRIKYFNNGKDVTVIIRYTVKDNEC
jgi:hypothetical protein